MQKRYKTYILLKLFQKLKRREQFQNFIRPTLPKVSEDNKKRNLQANIPDVHRCKNPEQIIKKLSINNTSEGLHTMIKWYLFQW